MNKQSTGWLIAEYDGDFDKAKDASMSAIFEVHRGTSEGSGYGIGGTPGTMSRDIGYYVPDENVASCKAALIAAGFTVREPKKIAPRRKRGAEGGRQVHVHRKEAYPTAAEP
jgi:hypothetical protein